MLGKFNTFCFAGNRDFIDIMDMPNTNKYSFDG